MAVERGGGEKEEEFDRCLFQEEGGGKRKGDSARRLSDAKKRKIVNSCSLKPISLFPRKKVGKTAETPQTQKEGGEAVKKGHHPSFEEREILWATTSGGKGEKGSRSLLNAAEEKKEKRNKGNSSALLVDELVVSHRPSESPWGKRKRKGTLCVRRAEGGESDSSSSAQPEPLELHIANVIDKKKKKDKPGCRATMQNRKGKGGKGRKKEWTTSTSRAKRDDGVPGIEKKGGGKRGKEKELRRRPRTSL